MRVGEDPGKSTLQNKFNELLEFIDSKGIDAIMMYIYIYTLSFHDLGNYGLTKRPNILKFACMCNVHLVSPRCSHL